MRSAIYKGNAFAFNFKFCAGLNYDFVAIYLIYFCVHVSSYIVGLLSNFINILTKVLSVKHFTEELFIINQVAS